MTVIEKLLLVVGVGTGTLLNAHAQQTTSPAAAAATTLTRQDTAAAVHELFASRRTGGAILTTFGGVFTGLLTASIAQVSDPGSGDKIGAAASITGAGLLPLGVGIGKLRRFSRVREAQVLSAYAASGKLDHKYRRRLRRTFQPVPGNTSWPELVSIEAAATAPNSTPAALLPDSAGQILPLASYTKADSLDAVLGLFMAKRFGGQLPALVLVPIGGLLAGSSNADGEYNVYTGQFEEKEPSTASVAAGLTLALGSVVYMYAHNAQYSFAKFDQLKTAYDAGAPLPATLRNQIKPKHFDLGREWRNKLARKAARKNRK